MPKLISVFLFDGFQLLDASGPLAAFEIAENFVPGSYTLVPLSINGGSVKSSSGVVMSSTAARHETIPDTLIIVGGSGVEKAKNCAKTITYIKQCGLAARRICSVCTGAFVLGNVGILDGQLATTHWRFADELQKLHPEIRVEADRIYVHAGKIWTSGGVSAGIDLALALISQDLGEAVARRIAQELVVYYRRPGGQSQFSALAELGGEETGFSHLLEWIRSHLSDRLTVEELASRMAMSPRNFSRAFTNAVGATPAKAVERLRLETARERVENSRDPIEEIALKTGFGDPERMRRAFLRAFGQPPQSVRRASQI